MTPCTKTQHFTVSRRVRSDFNGEQLTCVACQCGRLDEVLLDGVPVDSETLDTRDPQQASLAAEIEDLKLRTVELWP